MNQPIQEYLHNKMKLEQTFFNISNGIGNYYPRVTPIPKQEFETWYPLGSKVTLFDYIEKGQNPDRTRII